ncbi:unnamed protein product, partial [Brenthis ino]
MHVKKIKKYIATSGERTQRSVRVGSLRPAPRRTDMDLRLTRARSAAGRGRRGAGGVFTCGCRACRRRGSMLGGAGRGGARGAGRGAPAAMSPRAPGGGGEPRAARLDAARGHSAPPSRASLEPPRRRARSAAPALSPSSPLPRLRPVFLWARQLEGTVQEVRCEDYDARNRIRIARTPSGWRVIPRTEIYNSIRVPPPPAPARRRPRDRRRRRRCNRSRRARSAASPAVAPERPTPSAPALPPVWLQPDLESHIPSHTIAVPRPLQPSEPTPLDNLLAVAELEFNQQRGERLLDLESPASYPFLPAEEVARDVMSFELGDTKQAEESMYFERKAPPDRPEEYTGEMGSHKDLFETISEAHYLPELGGPHDEALLESLVEKGCEDNQILGQALDKLAHLVHGSGEYTEEDEHMLLSNEPVSDIINRLEQTLESPGQSSITAAQGLLHLHHIGDHLTQADHGQDVEQTYMSDEVFVPQDTQQCAMETLTAATGLQEVNEINHVEYEENVEKRLENDVGVSDELYTEPVSDSIEHFTPSKAFIESQAQLPDQSEINTLTERPNEDSSLNVCAQNCENIDDKTEDALNDNIKEEEVDQEMPEPMQNSHDEFIKDPDELIANEELIPTDLSIKNVENPPIVHANDIDTSNLEDNSSDRSDEQPRDLTVHRRQPTPHASPRRTDVPRAPSRESDAMQSPQPSGIPAVPSSPEIFTMPLTKSKQTLFLETLLSSPSPKMYTSEVTITKQQCEPLNLGKHRKSASPTVSSCSDEIRKLNKEFGEPQEKRLRRESTEELAKISKVFNKYSEEQLSKKSDKHVSKPCEEMNPVKQFHILKSNPDFNIPDPLLIPKDKIKEILANPGTKIPALLIQRPELRLPEAFAFPAILQDPDIILISLAQLERILIDEELQQPFLTPPPSSSNQKEKETKPSSSSKPTNSTSKEQANTSHPDQTSQPKPIPSMDALAGDIDAATSAALNQMLWLPYLNQLEAMAACSQNMDFLKALNSSGYSGQNYPDLSQMFNPSSRFMGPGGFPMMQPMDYDTRLQFAMWQEAMSHANASSSSQRSKSVSEQMKELSKSSDVQNPYVHSTKNHQNKPHSAARTSPITHNYNNQRPMSHNPFLQGMYPGMNTNMRPNMPLPGLQIPYFNPQMMGNQRSPRTPQQKSPSSPYYQNNNYLQSVKQSENHQRTQESPRPRISVKSLHNLLEPSAAAASGVSSRRTSSTPTSAMGRRREEPEVGSTTPLGEPTPHMPPHPHDPSSFHLWHPLFGK